MNATNTAQNTGAREGKTIRIEVAHIGDRIETQEIGEGQIQEEFQDFSVNPHGTRRVKIGGQWYSVAA